MRSRWMYIGSRLPSYSICFTSFQQLKAVVGIAHHIFGLAFYKDACVLVFSYIEGPIRLFILEQII